MKSEVLNMDCLEYLKACADKQFNLAIVDPPYGMRGLTGRNMAAGRGKLKNRIFDLSERKFNQWDIAPSTEYFDELFRVSENQIIWGGNYFDLPPVRGFAIWDKCQPFPNFSACEFAWTSFDCPSKIFHFDNRYGGKIHPTQKPVELYKWLLSKYAEHGWTIIDTHLGSGSSRIAAYDMGFDFVGIEIDREYFDKQEKRFKEYTAQIQLFEPKELFCQEE